MRISPFDFFDDTRHFDGFSSVVFRLKSVMRKYGNARGEQHASRPDPEPCFIWPVVMAVKGGSLKGLRVLDVGCNEGFWSLEAHKSGAAYVLGVDARAQHVEQAQLVRDALGIDPSHLEYRQMDVNDLSREQL